MKIIAIPEEKVYIGKKLFLGGIIDVERFKNSQSRN